MYIHEYAYTHISIHYIAALSAPLPQPPFMARMCIHLHIRRYTCCIAASSAPTFPALPFMACRCIHMHVCAYTHTYIVLQHNPPQLLQPSPSRRTYCVHRPCGPRALQAVGIVSSHSYYTQQMIDNVAIVAWCLSPQRSRGSSRSPA